MTAPEIATAIRSALDGMRESGPDELAATVNFLLRKTEFQLDENALLATVLDDDVNALSRRALHVALARWDAQSEGGWIQDTAPGTPERRARILSKLALSASHSSRIDETFPSVSRRDIVIASPGPWDPWYTPERKNSRDFYWKAYSGVLEAKGWSPEAIAALDESTSDLVGRLADPAGPTSYQAKGLVVGYVQSGKTANFTGIVSKAIDAGYRLIIVLTGTIELLRSQTQRRLDMELIGEENILGGKNRDNPDAVKDVDYIGADDADWFDHKFLRHGVSIVDQEDVPSIKRLTTSSGDYKLLKAGLDTLDFRRAGELADRTKPLYDPVNLFGADVRIAIVKKNKSVLEKLLRDLQDVHADLREIPTLIIDDEADQASVNTTNPRRVKKSKDDKDRTAINDLISQLLGKLERAQYVGYTATPFANVFISPDDSEDIFPRDFIISLQPSPDYMGGKKFHDLERLDAEEKLDPGISNERAFVRNLKADKDAAEKPEIQQALDAFVLSGAIKLWRAAQDPKLRFRHHTMLVHESIRTADQADLADLVRAVWLESEYSSAVGLARLRDHYNSDFVVVHASRAWGTELPESFSALRSYIGEAIDKITAATDPVVIVNGSKESDYSAMDFQTAPYWRVMVGGAKLSRGFTVEGLTVSYYRRRATAADTLMQMGRWFGYRPGYEDLVRLYIAREVSDARGKTYDLYDAFTAIIQDEEEFRAQLRRFSGYDETGHPQVRPIDVPPMVFQQLPWLKPAAANKMYNAVLDFQGNGGALRDFARQADRDPGGLTNAAHFTAVRSWVESMGNEQEFNYRDPATQKIGTFKARVAIVPADEMYERLQHFKWTENYSLTADLTFLTKAMEKGELEDWVVMLPYLKDSAIRQVDGLQLPLLTRTRRKDRGGFSGSSFRQRDAIERIAGKETAHGGESASALYTPTRGAMLLTFAADPVSEERLARDPKTWSEDVRSNDVATLFSFAVPFLSAPRGRIGFRVRDTSKSNSPIVDDPDHD